MMNEPHPGYIDLDSLYSFDYNTNLHLREIRESLFCISENLFLTPQISLASALAGFTLGAGHPTSVPFYSRSFPMPTKLTHHVTVNEKGRKVWRDDGPTGGN
jgi:hypothetical protein